MEASSSCIAASPWDWQRLRRACLREARGLVGDRDDAEEVAQEALIRAWRMRHACRASGDPLPWVRQIARMEAYRLLDRRRRRRLREVAEEPEELAQGVAVAPDDVPERLDVSAAVRRLSDGERALLHARYALDLSQSDAAQLLGMPEGTAKVRLHRIRLRLRESLAA
jgi:RNA polymerase sigma-70 factor, ECF subfamily